MASGHGCRIRCGTVDGRRDFSAEHDSSWYPDDRGYEGGTWRDGQDRYAEGPVPGPRDGGHDRHDRHAALGGSGGRRYADEPDGPAGTDYPDRRPVDPADPLGVGGDPLGVGGRTTRTSDADAARSGGFGRAAEFPLIGGARPGDLRTEDERPGHVRTDTDPGHPVNVPTGRLPTTTGPDSPDAGAARFHTQPIDRQALLRPESAGPGGAGFGVPGPGGFDPAAGSGPVPSAGGGVYGAGGGNENVYRSRRPLHAIVFTVATLVLEIVALRVLLAGIIASPVGTSAVLAGALLMIGLPVLAVGLYGVATGAAALSDPARAWLRAPGGYLVAGLVLLMSAAVAAG